MRSIIKRAKVLVIHHLTRQAKHLRNKKGSEDQKGKNGRRAERLIAEVEVIKDLKFDMVTKKALQEDVKFEDAIKPTATIEQRAIARLICHKIVNEHIGRIKEKYASEDFQKIIIEKRPEDDEVKNHEENNDVSKDENVSDTASDECGKGVANQNTLQGLESEKVANPGNNQSGQRSDAKCDMDVRIKSSCRDSIFSDSFDDVEVAVTRKANPGEYSTQMSSPVEFKVLGKQALQSTFFGSLSSAESDMRKKREQKSESRNKRKAKQSNVNQDLKRISDPSKNTTVFKDRQKIDNPCKADMGVKNYPPKKPKEERVEKKLLPAEKMHPSWEASKKRREQESTMVVFKGKKIKFNDD
ncbi:uncharacterized protein LOC100374379 isoform X2 [Saccoglossus kowalevskii]